MPVLRTWTQPRMTLTHAAHSLPDACCIHSPHLLQVESERVCQTGLEEEAELQWKQDRVAALAPCQNIKHTFARIARECTDVRFLAINVSPLLLLPRAVEAVPCQGCRGQLGTLSCA